MSGDPATGATTAESWSHDIALENLRRQALETEYTQGQAAQEFAYKQQQAALENARQEAQLGISKAAEARAAQQYGLQAKETQQAMAIKQAAEQREAGKFLTENLGMNPAQLQDMYKTTGEYNRFLAGAPVSRGSYEQFSNYYNSPSYQEQKPTTYFNAVQQMYMPTGNTQPVYQPQKSSQVYNIYGQHVGAW